MDLQEIITRGRFLMSSAPERLRVFELVNGKTTAKDIAVLTGRHVNNVRRDLVKLKDVELVRPRQDEAGEPVKRNGYQVFEKLPLARAVPKRYFSAVGKLPSDGRDKGSAEEATKARKGRARTACRAPTAQEILDICRDGEDQLYEFKGQGAETRKMCKEIAAMLNTTEGGLILYGVEDDGTVQGTDVSRQRFDQSLQNSVRNAIQPAATIRLYAVDVMGAKVLVVAVPPWNGKDVYQYEGRVHLRKGTNVFRATPGECKRLNRGKAVV